MERTGAPKGGAGEQAAPGGGAAGALEDWLLDILVCPEDKGPLWYVPAEQLFYNPRLKRRYAIRDGIPDLLVEDAETVGEAEHERLSTLHASGSSVRVTGGGSAGDTGAAPGAG